MTADLSALDIERRLTAIEAALPTFATKADIQALRVEIQAMRTEWKAEFGELKAELHAREARLIKWVATIARSELRVVRSENGAGEDERLGERTRKVVAGAAAAAGVAIGVNQVLGAGVGG